MTHEEMVQLAQETAQKLHDAAKENGFKLICAMHVGDKSYEGKGIYSCNEVTRSGIKNFLDNLFDELTN